MSSRLVSFARRCAAPAMRAAACPVVARPVAVPAFQFAVRSFAAQAEEVRYLNYT